MIRSEKPLEGKKIPAVVAMETVNYCNSKCVFCPLFQGQDRLDRKLRPKTTMSTDLFKKIVAEIASWPGPPQLIYLNVHGEPLLDRRLVERLALLQEFGFSRLVDLQTNGELLTPQMSEAIIRSGVGRLTLGFDGATPQVYESHRVGCHYERVLKNIRDFVEVRKRLQGATRLAIQYVRTKANAHEVAPAYHLFRQLLDPSKDCFQDQLSKNWASQDLEANGIIWESRPENCGPPIPCPMIDRQLIILADGSVAACCWDYNFSVFGEPLGNAGEESILSIFNGTKFTQLRNILQREGSYNKPARCLSCFYLYPQDELTVEQAAITDKRLITICAGGYVYAFQPQNLLIRVWTKIRTYRMSSQTPRVAAKIRSPADHVG
jgi:hypothetical protein